MSLWTATFEIPDDRMGSEDQAQAREAVMDGVSDIIRELMASNVTGVHVLLCDTHGDEILRL